MSQEKDLLFRMIVPAFPAFNVYSRIARQTTALGPVCVATVISRMDGWCVEMIDENNYRKFGPRDNDGWPDHSLLQTIRHAEYAGFYGGLSRTGPAISGKRRCHYRGRAAFCWGEYSRGAGKWT